MKIVLASQILASLNALTEVKRLKDSHNQCSLMEHEDNIPKHASASYPYASNRDCYMKIANSEDDLWETPVEQVSTQSHDKVRGAAWDTGCFDSDFNITEKVTADQGTSLNKELPQFIEKCKIPINIFKKRRNGYSKDVVDVALKMFYQENMRKVEISRILDIPYTTLDRWIRNAIQNTINQNTV